MYWNSCFASSSRSSISWLIETWDVLKSMCAPTTPFAFAINRNMRCIEIPIFRDSRSLPCLINRNMRCIEMAFFRYQKEGFYRLIETWDVLKYLLFQYVFKFPFKINRNMRCIEMQNKTGDFTSFTGINRNMRCIEIFSVYLLMLRYFRLIETWDVLKYTDYNYTDTATKD